MVGVRDSELEVSGTIFEIFNMFTASLSNRKTTWLTILAGIKYIAFFIAFIIKSGMAHSSSFIAHGS
jgi:hypothetical protein